MTVGSGHTVPEISAAPLTSGVIPANTPSESSVSVLIYARGDCNKDGATNAADVVYLINYLFQSGLAPDPLELGDANCDAVVDGADVVHLINYLYQNGSPPRLLSYPWRILQLQNKLASVMPLGRAEAFLFSGYSLTLYRQTLLAFFEKGSILKERPYHYEGCPK
jgi:hypothetical protein